MKPNRNRWHALIKQSKTPLRTLALIWFGYGTLKCNQSYCTDFTIGTDFHAAPLLHKRPAIHTVQK